MNSHWDAFSRYTYISVKQLKRGCEVFRHCTEAVKYGLRVMYTFFYYL